MLTCFQLFWATKVKVSSNTDSPVKGHWDPSKQPTRQQQRAAFVWVPRQLVPNADRQVGESAGVHSPCPGDERDTGVGGPGQHIHDDDHKRDLGQPPLVPHGLLLDTRLPQPLQIPASYADDTQALTKTIQLNFTLSVPFLAMYLFINTSPGTAGWH